MRRITLVLYAARVHGSLALFPLTTALVPGLILSLHIFEPRYRQLVADLMVHGEEDDREFGLIAVRDGRDPHRDGADALYPVGVTALLRSATPYEDGRFDIVVVGSRRFQVVDLDVSEPLVRAEVEYLEDRTDSEDFRWAVDAERDFATYRAVLAGQVDADHAGMSTLPDDPSLLAYLITAAMVLDVHERQELLAAPSTTARLQGACRLLRRETGIITQLHALPAVEPLGQAPSIN